jgi:glycerol transport system permease protein
MKPRPWLFLLPALFLVALSALIPLMTVVNYSLHFLVPGSEPTYVGLENYREVLNDANFMTAIRRQFLFTAEVLLIEIPLGLLVALALPRQGWRATGCLLLLGVPLLIPWNVVGMVWRVFTRADLGVVPAVLGWFGYDYRPAQNMTDAWWTVIVMDAWHWAPLVALLCYAGLQTIPAPYYQAARIDGASGWATFRYVTLPRLRYVLIIAVLLRAMDSFNIYSEPYVLTGGFINFMSIYVSNQALSAFNLSTGAAMSVVYLYVVLILCHVLYSIMQNIGKGARS